MNVSNENIVCSIFSNRPFLITYHYLNHESLLLLDSYKMESIKLLKYFEMHFEMKQCQGRINKRNCLFFQFHIASDKKGIKCV